MSDIELKPCPFCGRSGAILDEPLNEDEYGCFCNAHCGAIGPCDEDGEKAMEFWNTRPLEDAANARAEAAEAKVAALQAELIRAIDIYKDPAVAHANILNGRIVLPKFYVNITDDFGPVADLRAALDAAINMNIEKNAEVVRLTAALAAANEDAERLASVLSDDGKLPPNAKRLSLAAHRARVGDIL